MQDRTGESFDFTLSDGVAHIRLAQPERGHPIDLRFAVELSRLANECSEAPGVRCVLLDAEGRFFGVGADLKTMRDDRAALQRFVRDATTALHSALSRLARMDAPLVVAVQGLAVGGAVSLCAAADFCLAAASARFYAGYTGIGLACDAGGSTFLPRRLGPRRAAEFLLLNQHWTAAEAAAHGLVSRVVPDDGLQAEAWALARQLAQGPTRAYGEIKNLLLSTFEQPIEAQLEQEARAIARTARSDDAWNAIQAVADKRPPTFTGR